MRILCWAQEGMALSLNELLSMGMTEWNELFVSAWGLDTREIGEIFWSDLVEWIVNFGGQYNVVVLENLKAKVRDDSVENVAGRYGVPRRNDCGVSLLANCLDQE